MNLHYIIGDATKPVHMPALICHCNNSSGGWGRGFVLALSAKYPEPERAYREWFRTGKPQLGDCQTVQVKQDIWVANLIGQFGTQWIGKTPPIRYDAIEKALKQAYEFAKQNDLTMACPRLGCVLAGGEWIEIETILLRTMTVETYVYTLSNQAWKWKDPYES